MNVQLSILSMKIILIITGVLTGAREAEQRALLLTKHFPGGSTPGGKLLQLDVCCSYIHIQYLQYIYF